MKDMPYPTGFRSAMEMSTIWPEIRPFVKIEVYGRDGAGRKPRHRIEILPMPEDLSRRALVTLAPCCACGRFMHPFRRRQAPSKRQRGSRAGAAHIYYACACPLDVSVACSRGEFARFDYIRVAEIVGPTVPA